MSIPGSAQPDAGISASGYGCHIRMLYLTWPVQMSLTKQRSDSLNKRVVVLLKMY